MSYGLGGMVTATVTDNGSNFVKAFQVFHKTASETEEEEDGSESVTFEDLHNVLSSSDGDGNDGTISLPHRRCTCHKLIVISTTDIEKRLFSNSDIRAVYRSTIAKCWALWTKASRSTLASETGKFSRRKLLVPTTTRWTRLKGLCAG